MEKQVALDKLSKWSGVSVKPLVNIASLSRPQMVDLATILNIPSTYAKKCPDDLLRPQIDYWLSKTTKSIYQLAKGDSIFGLNSDSNCYVDPVQIFQAIDKAVPGVSNVDYLHINGAVRCGMVTNKNTQVRVGDIVQYGVQFEVYPVGKYAKYPEVSSYLYRLVCSNGMISATNTFNCKKKDMDDVLDWAGRVARIAWERAEQEADLLKRMDTVKLPADLEKVTKHIVSKIMIPISVRKLLVDRIKAESPHTMYDLWNIVTAIGAGLGQTELSGYVKEAAGRLMSHYTVCSTCHRPF